MINIHITKQATMSTIAILIIGILFLVLLFSVLPHNSSKDGSTSEPKLGTTASNSEDSFPESTASYTRSSSSSESSSVSIGQVATISHSPSSPTFTTKSGKTFPLRTYKTLGANDPNATQWWTTSTGLNSAWDIGPGTNQTVVAIIDTGFSLQHEEFQNRWAINSGEQGDTTSEAPSKYNCTDRQLLRNQSCNRIDDNYDGVVDNESGATTAENPSQLNCTQQGVPISKSCNLLDDDSNDYIDDVTGWDFANYDQSVEAGQTNPDGSGTTHGTQVAGVLAATGNNSKGIAGVNWTTKVLPLQVLNDDSYGNTLTVARAIFYAADRGVDVINISLGSDSEDPYLRQAIQYAIDKDIVVVAASGNDGCDCISYPARYPEVFSIGAQQPNGSASSFSSYGISLDVMAPGENITSTTWTKYQPTNSYSSGIAGTSFAAPYISGLLSLAKSHQVNASWGEITNNLMAVATHTNLSYNYPTSPTIGSGFARADNLMKRVTTPQTPIIRYTFGATPLLGTLSSNRTYQCFNPEDFPTAPLYRVANASSIFYTIDTLEYVRAIARGDSVRSLGPTCVGLPRDNPSTMRIINLLSELDNMPIPKR
jgi:hypothetical protein